MIPFFYKLYNKHTKDFAINSRQNPLIFPLIFMQFVIDIQTRNIYTYKNNFMQILVVFYFDLVYNYRNNRNIRGGI